jgi:predicted lipoprotein
LPKGYLRLSSTGRKLSEAASALRARPGEPTLRAARQAWQDALAALAYTYALQTGAIAEVGFHLREAYWPVRPAGIDELSADPAVDVGRIARVSPAKKGLFAMEYLLFDSGDSAPVLLTSERSRRLFSLLADEYERAAGAVEGAAVVEDLPRRLADRGQEGVSLLVNGLIETVETVGVAFEPASVADAPAENVVLLPGARSGSTRAIALAKIEGVRDHYLDPPGRGLAAVVSAVAPEVDQSIHEALRAAQSALGAIPADAGPNGGTRPEVVRAAEACRALEKTMKSGLASALGVTLTVRSADGD